MFSSFFTTFNIYFENTIPTIQYFSLPYFLIPPKESMKTRFATPFPTPTKTGDILFTFPLYSLNNSMNNIYLNSQYIFSGNERS